MATRILLIEDEEAIQELIAFSLTQAGYEVFRASDAEQGLQMVQNNLPDLIVLDWMLPKMSGIECARRTVAKYREALKIPTTTLRKAL